MKVTSAQFLRSCRSISDLPRFPHPEFAFMGRSNVGKSSLINMITGRKNLVKTGSSPGVTRAINFFILNGNIIIADLPGYGYAKVPKSLKKTFIPLITGYITRRENLRLVFLLIDIRRIPDERERKIISLLSENHIRVAITVTKCDKVSTNDRIRKLRELEKELKVEKDSLFLTSVKTGEGKAELLSLIDDFRKVKD